MDLVRNIQDVNITFLVAKPKGSAGYFAKYPVGFAHFDKGPRELWLAQNWHIYIDDISMKSNN